MARLVPESEQVQWNDVKDHISNFGFNNADVDKVINELDIDNTGVFAKAWYEWTGELATDSLKKYLQKLKLSLDSTFEVVGDCESLADAQINWYHPERPDGVKEAMGISALPTFDEFTLLDVKCACPGDSAGKKSGKGKLRRFQINWTFELTVGQFSMTLTVQKTRITVTTPCCCPTATGTREKE